MKRLYTVKELADEAGISTSALRAWERRFAIFSPDRTPGGHRLYNLDDLKILWYVKKQQASGRDLKEISECGRDVLLKAARAFFTQESENNGETSESSESDIVAALCRCELGRAQSMVENLYSVSTSATDFATTAISILHRLRSAEIGTKPYCVTFFEDLVTHLCLDSILHSRTPPKNSALCLNYAQRESIQLLRTALHLRRWGFAVTFINRPPHAKDLAELLEATKPLLVCAGFSFESTQDAAPFVKTAGAIGEHTLCCVTDTSLQPNENSPNSLPSNVYFVNSLLEFEILAMRRAEDPRVPHIDILKKFKSEFG